MRPNPTDMFNDPITIAMRGASMWGDHDEIEDILLSMAEEDNQKFDRLSEREKKSARVANWENEKLEELGSLRNQAFATNRGHYCKSAPRRWCCWQEQYARLFFPRRERTTKISNGRKQENPKISY